MFPAILACALTACALAVPAGAAPVDVQTLQVAGTYRHPSGVEFPAAVAGFARVEVTQFDAKGEDVGVGYNFYGKAGDTKAPLAVTLYIYPGARVSQVGSPPKVVEQSRRQVLEAEFAHVQNDIVAAHPDARLLKTGPARRGRNEGLEATYAFADGSRSQALLFRQANQWFVASRGSGLGWTEAEVAGRVDKLLAGLRLPRGAD